MNVYILITGIVFFAAAGGVLFWSIDSFLKEEQERQEEYRQVVRDYITTVEDGRQ